MTSQGRSLSIIECLVMKCEPFETFIFFLAGASPRVGVANTNYIGNTVLTADEESYTYTLL